MVNYLYADATEGDTAHLPTWYREKIVMKYFLPRSVALSTWRRYQ